MPVLAGDAAVEAVAAEVLVKEATDAGVAPAAAIHDKIDGGAELVVGIAWLGGEVTVIAALADIAVVEVLLHRHGAEALSGAKSGTVGLLIFFAEGVVGARDA